jgi:hypothetical protein
VNYDNAWEPQGEEKSGIRQYIQSLEDKVKAMETERMKEKADAEKAVKSATFESLGIKSSVASLYSGDANPDAIKSWVTDMRSAFGGAAPEQSDQGQTSQRQAEPVLTSDQQQQYQRMVDAGQSSDTNTLADMNARLAQATSRDELHQIWRSGNF